MSVYPSEDLQLGSCASQLGIQLVSSEREGRVSGVAIISYIYYLYPHDTGSFSKDDFSQGAEYQVFLGVFLMFLAFFHSKIWAKFHFGTFKPYD